MQTIERNRGSEDDLGFEVDLRDYGKTLADISDIFFVIKENKSDVDADIFLKTKVAGEITVTGSDELIVAVKWLATEYTNFVIDKTYFAGLFIKFTGQTVADENVDQVFHLIVRQDMLQNN